MKSITVRNLEIGTGLPKIIVPIMEKNEAAVMAATDAIARSCADAVELRVDALENPTDMTEVMAVIRACRDSLPMMPLLVTMRTSKEGGLAELSDEQYHHFLKETAASGLADLLDIEGARAGAVMADIEKTGVKVVMSYHDFEKTPVKEEILAIMHRLEAQGAAIVKTAFMANSYGEAEALLAASKAARTALNVPFIAIAMGERGMISRTSGEVYGSAMTFGALGKCSAPGQLEVTRLRRILSGIHRIRQAENVLYLIGFMGTGKSAVARQLGRMTGQIVYEADDMIEKAAGCTIKTIFENEGEEGFRARETHLMKALAREKGGIVSCGGGVVTREENINLMRYSGCVILLTAKPETICRRLSREIDKRPVLQGSGSVERVEALLEGRRAAYEAAAHRIIETDEKNTYEVAEEIILTVENLDEVL
ncbi:MAG: type I 3-dehydroquinate dehydratase [Lachnospiraceae bacterium]|nr:type I 3-dehydroquinate dehydratase [Lachnospiraceae bacterium]